MYECIYQYYIYTRIIFNAVKKGGILVLGERKPDIRQKTILLTVPLDLGRKS